ncbi:hypothetical protein JJJ17_19025 [Paracoccus caeni]|uniref:Uncharacterized protein n=1 Tax=Paracoccus caeni TaxID=657651 RepID=A0A934W0F2_9RHOB|nr:hypothetical protein [Paracoccus caeni]MBK4218027.1 hypothetical protein [Paracoccus caeni]
MSKADKSKTHESGGTRLREFTRQERESGVHPSVAALHSRPQTRSDENRKVTEYSRIERGHTV